MSAAAACLRPSGLPGEKGPCQPWRVGWGRPRQDGRPLEGLPAPPCRGEGSATTPLPNVCLVGIPLGRRLPPSLSHWTPRRGHPIRVWSPTTPLTPSLSPILVGHGAQIRAKTTPVPARDFSKGSLRIGGHADPRSTPCHHLLQALVAGAGLNRPPRVAGRCLGRRPAWRRTYPWTRDAAWAVALPGVGRTRGPSVSV